MIRSRGDIIRDREARTLVYPSYEKDIPSTEAAMLPMRINVEEKFKSQDYPPIMKDPDYTNYPAGKEDVITKVAGVISQRGLHKRNFNKFQEKVKGKMKQIPPGQDKPVQNYGILAVFDKFFNWINRNLGG